MRSLINITPQFEIIGLHKKKNMNINEIFNSTPQYEINCPPKQIKICIYNLLIIKVLYFIKFFFSCYTCKCMSPVTLCELLEKLFKHMK